MDAIFKKTSQNRMFQDVVEQIQEAILDGRLKPGTRLPSERRLQEAFSASRGTLREALRVLEQKGLISIRTGVKGGAVVNALTTEQISQSLDLLIRYQRVSLRDLAEFREGVEGNVAVLAVERAGPEDIALLEQLLREAEKNLKKGASGWDEFIRIDNEIHIKIAEIANNPVYISILKTIYGSINKYFDKFLPRKEELLYENYDDLCNIVNAVANRQAARAHLLVQTHVYRFNCIMEENARKET
jgi:GntR family transcriptional regulator, transcriptional repressor for pyruvate dehydrogenase complex